MTAAVEEAPRPRFLPHGAFHYDVKARVEAWLAQPGRSARDVPAMYAKTAIILAWFAVSWTALVFFASSWWAAGALSVSLGLAVATIGSAVMHDANHGAYSRHVWVNRVAGWALDAMGASSYIWRTKHNAAHHTWTNLDAHDDDLHVGPFARLTVEQPLRAWHRAQHLYMWGLYGFLLPKWAYFDDFVNLSTGRVGSLRLDKPSRGEWAALWAGKVTFTLWALVIPLWRHDLLSVLVCLVVASFATGVTLAVTFQLAHCVEDAGFPVVAADGRLGLDFAEHQLATTVDFAPGNPIVTFLAGGLNYQVEHHLFPKVCHLHYPALARIVEATARDHGVAYRVTPGLWAAIGSHYRMLRKMGAAAPAPHRSVQAGLVA